MRKYHLSVVGVLSLLIGLAVAQNAPAATTTLTFDGFANGTTLTKQYQSLGVTVSGANVVADPNAVSPPNDAYSPSGLMTFTLDSTITGNVNTVSAYVTGANTGLYAYDASGNLLGQSILPAGAPNNTRLSVTSSGNPIASVSIHDGGSAFTIDNLSFSSGVVPVPFASFTPSLAIAIGTRPNTDSFGFNSSLTLGANGKVFAPATDVVLLQFGTVTVTVPADAFQRNEDSAFAFKGLVGSVNVHAEIQPQGANKYRVKIAGTGASLTGIANPVSVTLTIGNNTGNTSVKAIIAQPKSDKGVLINPFGR